VICLQSIVVVLPQSHKGHREINEKQLVNSITMAIKQNSRNNINPNYKISI